MPKGKTMWRKENQSGNEMINFREVWGCTKGLHHKSEQTFCHNRRINMNEAHNLHCSWVKLNIKINNNE